MKNKLFTLLPHSESSSLPSLAIISTLLPHNNSNSSGDISAIGSKCWLPMSDSPSRIGSVSLKGPIGGSSDRPTRTASAIPAGFWNLEKTFAIFRKISFFAKLSFANFLFNFLRGRNFREKMPKTRKFLPLKYP